MDDKQPSQLSDAELVAEVGHLAASERRITSELVAHLAELEARGLHLRAGFTSLFAYCTETLRPSEAAAYNRIEAAHLARRYPAALDLLAQGLLNLATLRLLGPHLTPENQDQLFAAASGRSKRDAERMLAGMFPRPDVTASIRKLPATERVGTMLNDVRIDQRAAEDCAAAALGAASRSLEGNGLDPEATGGAGGLPTTEPMDSLTNGSKATGDAAAPALMVAHTGRSALPRHPVVTALSADRYQFRFTGSEAMQAKFRRAQDLLRHAVPSGDPGEIFDRALAALLKQLEKKKFAASDRPRADGDHESVEQSGSRTVPAAVRRAVAARDGGGCAFVAEGGHRCGATAFLEYHHVVPYARGGPPTETNIQLRCQAHNGYEADLDFGRRERTEGNSSRDELGFGDRSRTLLGTTLATNLLLGDMAGRARDRSGRNSPRD